MSLSSKEYFIRETGKSIKRNGIMSFLLSLRLLFPFWYWGCSC